MGHVGVVKILYVQGVFTFPHPGEDSSEKKNQHHRKQQRPKHGASAAGPAANTIEEVSADDFQIHVSASSVSRAPVKRRKTSSRFEPRISTPSYSMHS